MTTSLQRVEKYIFDFITSRMEHLNSFYYSTVQTKQTGIYTLKHGHKLMDMLNSIHGNIQEELWSKNLVPQKFTTPEQLFQYLNSFKEYLISQEPILKKNYNGAETNYIVAELIQLKDNIIKMIEYSKEIYDVDDTIIPYKELRHTLIIQDIPEFIKLLKSILASVSYAIVRASEGYHHSNVHLILKMLGFEIISEETTNVGRIDAVIRFIDTIYIIEFKFSDSEDESDLAVQQIIDKKYNEKYYVEKKKIIGIGISFSEKDRNINGFKEINL